jgi:uroporphyrinogen-III synthase
MGHKVQLLSTVNLEQQFIDKAADASIALNDIAFTRISPIVDKELEREIALLCRQPLNVAFTSANAVSAVSMYTDKPSKWQIYCIGNATKEAVLEYFDAANIQATAKNAISLAKCIAEKNIKEVVFFCSDKRMDTLPAYLQKAGIALKEVIVYKTEEVPQVVVKEYDGILFFSPSGVSSFFSLNKIPVDTMLFAIGNTTADAIKEHVGNQVMISDNPSKDQIVTDAINYFHTKAIAG